LIPPPLALLSPNRLQRLWHTMCGLMAVMLEIIR
jgi:hypothetical protein